MMAAEVSREPARDPKDCTSTRLADGSVTAEVARRRGDGTWLWVILYGVTRGGELRRLGNFQRAQKELQR